MPGQVSPESSFYVKRQTNVTATAVHFTASSELCDVNGSDEAKYGLFYFKCDKGIASTEALFYCSSFCCVLCTF